MDCTIQVEELGIVDECEYPVPEETLPQYRQAGVDYVSENDETKGYEDDGSAVYGLMGHEVID